jgi:hypothetical protein
MANPPDKLRLLGDGALKNDRRKYGAQSGGLMACLRKPDTHGFHPVFESCPMCLSWAEEQEERAKRVTVKSAEPVKVERSLGRRVFDKATRLGTWDTANQAAWERAAKDELLEKGLEYFDAMYP